MPSLTVLISLSLKAVLADSTTTTNLIFVFVTYPYLSRLVKEIKNWHCYKKGGKEII